MNEQFLNNFIDDSNSKKKTALSFLAGVIVGMVALYIWLLA